MYPISFRKILDITFLTFIVQPMQVVSLYETV